MEALEQRWRDPTFVADAHAWIDYMQIAKFNGEWKIVNVLWEMRQ